MTHFENQTSVPSFAPVLPRHGRQRLRRTLRGRRTFGLALTLTAGLFAVLALGTSGPSPATEPGRAEQPARAAPGERAPAPGAALPPPSTPPPTPALWPAHPKATDTSPHPPSTPAASAPAPDASTPDASAPGTAAPRDLALVVSAPVRISDAATVQLLTPGDRVDVLATPAAPLHADSGTAPRQAQRIAHRARVAQIPAIPRGGQTGSAQGALIVLAVSPATAAALAGAAADSHLTVTKW